MMNPKTYIAAGILVVALGLAVVGWAETGAAAFAVALAVVGTAAFTLGAATAFPAATAGVMPGFGPSSLIVTGALALVLASAVVGWAGTAGLAFAAALVGTTWSLAKLTSNKHGAA